MKFLHTPFYYVASKNKQFPKNCLKNRQGFMNANFFDPNFVAKSIKNLSQLD